MIEEQTHNVKNSPIGNSRFNFLKNCVKIVIEYSRLNWDWIIMM